MVVKKILSSYSWGSRKVINWNKSFVFFINTPTERQRKIATIMGYDLASLPSIYWGSP